MKHVPGLGLVMLGQETWCARAQGCTNELELQRGIVLRHATLERPWSWSAPLDTSAEGYGPYILDGSAVWTAETRTLSLWHLGSTWRGSGTTTTPYGVQLTQSDVQVP